MDHVDNIQVSLAAGESEPPEASRTLPGSILQCPNCGAPGEGQYCSVCGEALEPKLPHIHHYVKEFLHDLLALDSKLFRTVPALLFRPGFLTMEYLAGRRNRYLIPSRLYLLTAFVVFFALGSYLRSELAKSTQTNSKSVTYAFGKVQGEDAKKAVEKLLSLAITVSPYVILLGSTPVFAGILKLLYRKKKRLYIEHLIFSYHFFAFALIVQVGGLLIWPKFGGIIGFALFMIYLFVALKRVYHDRGFGLVARFLLSMTSYFGIAVIAIIVTVITAGALGVYTGDIPDPRNGGAAPTFHFKDSVYVAP